MPRLGGLCKERSVFKCFPCRDLSVQCGVGPDLIVKHKELKHATFPQNFRKPAGQPDFGGDGGWSPSGEMFGCGPESCLFDEPFRSCGACADLPPVTFRVFSQQQNPLRSQSKFCPSCAPRGVGRRGRLGHREPR